MNIDFVRGFMILKGKYFLKNGLYDLNYKGYPQAMMINCYRKFYDKELYDIKE